MLYNVMEVANYIIDKCCQKNKPVSNLQLQKMLFFAWVDYYKKTGKPLFWDSICAWQFGPVVPEVYYEYCVYGGRPININCETEIKDCDGTILDGIIDKYIDMPVSTLVDMTHANGSAWDVVYQNGKGNRNAIPYELIKAKEGGGENVS